MFRRLGLTHTLDLRPCFALRSPLPARSPCTAQLDLASRPACYSASASSDELAIEEAKTSASRTGEAASRRVKGARAPEESGSLKHIPGVGPKNAKLLTDAGYSDLSAVEKWFLTECSKDVDTFLQQLQVHVGIKQRRHRETIAHYITQRLQEDDPLSRYVTLSVEGNISAGKSTFLNGITSHCPDLQDLLHVSPEPVDRWQNVGNHNLLDKFYHDKQRYAYTFQNYIFFTRMMQEQDSARAMRNQPYRLLERSIFCDRMVFVESLRDSKIMSEMELSIYDSWFDPIVKMAPTLVPDGFIYLRATPQTCMSRLKHRARDEETGVDIGYLEDLHNRHDEWLYQIHENSDPNIKLEFQQMREIGGKRPELRMADRVKRMVQDSLTAPPVPSAIKDDVKILNKDVNGRLHSSIHHLPALVLDCEKDIHDRDAQKEHASKVNCYFEYVKAMRKHRAQFMALEDITKDPGDSVEEVWRKFNAAKTLLEPRWKAELDELFHRAIAQVNRPGGGLLLPGSKLAISYR